MIFIIAQAFGVLAVILTFISYQYKSSKALIIVQTLSTLAMCTHYILLGASTGFVLNILCIMRNIVYCFKDKKPLNHPSIPYVLAAFITVAGFFSWQSPISLLIISALAINTVFLSKPPQMLRKSILLTSSLVLIYNVFNIAIGGAINEAVAIISSVIGIYRFRNKSKQ